MSSNTGISYIWKERPSLISLIGCVFPDFPSMTQQLNQ